MKFYISVILTVLCLIFSVLTHKNISTEKRIKRASSGIAQLIDKFSEMFNVQFNLLIIGNSSNLLKIADETLKMMQYPYHVKMRLESINDNKIVINEAESHVVLLNEDFNVDFTMNMDNPKNRENLNEDIFLAIPFKKIFNFEYYYGNDFKRSFKFKTSNNKELHHYRFQIRHESNEELLLFNNVLFSGKSCQAKFEAVNSYSLRSLMWSKQPSEYVQTFKDFFECPILVSIPAMQHPYNFNYQKANNRTKLGGINGVIAEEFAQRHNFTFKISRDKEFEMNMYGPRILAFDMYGMEDFYMMQFGNFQFQMIAQSRFGYCVAFGRKYDAFEKMILPFDDITWYLVVSSFAIGYITILILYCSPRYYQQFVFGTYVRDPSLNLIQIFFGIGLVETPGRNFARYLFTMFTLFCLVIRTSYQGKMFEFLTSDVRKPTANSVQDLIDMQIPVAETYDGFYSANEIVHNDLRLKTYNDINKRDIQLMQNQYLYDNDTFAVICEVNYQGPFKYNHMIGRRLEKYLFESCKKNSKDEKFLSDACKNIRDESYLSESYKYMKSIRDDYTWGGHYISFRKFGYLYEPFERFLLDIHQNGIFWILHDRVMNDTALPEHDDPRVVLTLDMLSAGFYIWIICVIVCCLVFICELIIDRVKDWQLDRLDMNIYNY